MMKKSITTSLYYYIFFTTSEEETIIIKNNNNNIIYSLYYTPFRIFKNYVKTIIIIGLFCIEETIDIYYNSNMPSWLFFVYYYTIVV